MTHPLQVSKDYIPIPNKEVVKVAPTNNPLMWAEIENVFLKNSKVLQKNRQKFEFSSFLGMSNSYFSQFNNRIKNGGGVNSSRIAKTANNINEQYKKFMEQI